jgi:Uma2 family endonuclease
MTGTGLAKKKRSPVAGELTGAISLFRMTSDQFCELPPGEEVKLELLDGQVIMSPRPTSRHQYFLAGLLVMLVQWTKAKRLGRILPDTLIKLDGRWTPAPDLIFVARRHLKRVAHKRVEGPVDLAVEILSESTAHIDVETKYAAYARYGITWYWIFDL